MIIIKNQQEQEIAQNFDSEKYFFMPYKNNNANSKPNNRYVNRTLVRTTVFQLLYQEEMNSGSAEEWGENFLNESLPDHEEIVRFARRLIAGIREKKAEIDEKIAAQAKNWTIDRISATDKNILRLALYELLYAKTPKAIVISEAIKLADKFGSENSSSFVNGILDKFS
ncbi:MAG: transcription antitermination factor NusB [Planctomycetaceae bacterium]|jgi:N utilization substance protein B|nr:transcription antitermination factor NusB [Planctomycetaceae bacterium]